MALTEDEKRLLNDRLLTDHLRNSLKLEQGINNFRASQFQQAKEYLIESQKNEKNFPSLQLVQHPTLHNSHKDNFTINYQKLLNEFVNQFNQMTATHIHRMDKIIDKMASQGLIDSNQQQVSKQAIRQSFSPKVATKALKKLSTPDDNPDQKLNKHLQKVDPVFHPTIKKRHHRRRKTLEQIKNNPKKKTSEHLQQLYRESYQYETFRSYSKAVSKLAPKENKEKYIEIFQTPQEIEEIHPEQNQNLSFKRSIEEETNITADEALELLFHFDKAKNTLENAQVKYKEPELFNNEEENFFANNSNRPFFSNNNFTLFLTYAMHQMRNEKKKEEEEMLKNIFGIN